MTTYICLSCRDVYDDYEAYHEHFRQPNGEMNYLACQRKPFGGTP